ncbi:hypothetical protein SLEP1_g16928 [Rubroshorea leprosula]|uniref:Transcription repressor n=1 Tax=Rubroshorea leprosula TaxID=152421 RepID=A0AAV5ISJ4_9ROSI|nr:hypothetical protein SLEP1_g16928 [Rubroshorea leprosula]
MMAKLSVKLKLSRVIHSFQLCRSKDRMNLVETPRPVSYRMSPVNPKALDISFPNLPSSPPSTPNYSFEKSCLSPKVASVNCGCRAKSSKWYLSSEYGTEEGAARLHMVDRAHDPRNIQGNISNATSFKKENNGDISPVRVGKYEKRQKEKKIMMKVKPSISSSESGRCSSEGEGNEEETENLISFSDDSLFEFHNPNKKRVNNVKKIKLRSHASKKYRKKADQSPVIPNTVEGKVRESVAVVKKSDDPYEDFKRSMLEMILEKQMFEAKDLEELLQCFLSLNSRQHHGVIVEAFTGIWELLFCNSCQ